MRVRPGPGLAASTLAAAALAMTALLLEPVAAGAQPASENAARVPTVPTDGVSTINGVDVACTGIGETRDDPRWSAYSVRVEFSNARNEYLVGAVVSVSDREGHPILIAACDGPWLLLKLEPGDYKVFARLIDSAAQPRSATVRAPRTGQLRVVMQFRDAS